MEGRLETIFGRVRAIQAKSGRFDVRLVGLGWRKVDVVPFPQGSRSRPGTAEARASPEWGSRSGDVPAVLGWVLAVLGWVLLSRPSATATLLFLLCVRNGLQPLSPPCPAPNDWDEP